MKAYLLAAGNGKRSGGPKAWREHEGKPLLEKQMGFLGERFKPENIAISIQAEWIEKCRAINRATTWVPVDPEAPPMATVLGLLKTSPLTEWGFLYHVDMPVWEPELFALLARRTPEAEAEALIPAYREKKGHPVVLSPQIHKKLLALDPLKDRLDYWLQTRKVQVVDVPFACILENWNAPPLW